MKYVSDSFFTTQLHTELYCWWCEDQIMQLQSFPIRGPSVTAFWILDLTIYILS